MIIFPIYSPRRGRRARKPAAATPTPPAPIEVTSVAWNGTNDLTWNFSAAVTLSAANVPELENDIDGTGMWQAPTGCSQGSGGAATSIVATYPDPPQESSAWRIAAQPSGIEQGGQVTVPQGGSVA